MTLFVKFVPYNIHTIHSLITESVKFSTVYELNDFNELRLIGQPTPNDDFKKIIANKLYDFRIKNEIIKGAYLAGKYDKKYLKGFEERLVEFNGKNIDIFQNEKQGINDWGLLIENLAFNNVGIFCVSKLSVFEDDSAQLMFAHYGANLKGLALIYEINNPPNKFTDVTYDNELKVSSGLRDRVQQYLSDKYDDIGDFKIKSKKWEYENEYRMFDKPDIYKAKDKGIELKAILYTSRFGNDPKFDSEAVLKRINDIYNNKLIIEEIRADHSYYYFVVAETNQKIPDYLANKLNIH